MRIYETDLLHGTLIRRKPIFSIAYHDDIIVTGSIDGEAKIWRNFELIQEIINHVGTVMCLNFSSDGSILASAGDDGMICIYKRKTYFEIYKKITAHKSDITSLIFSSNFLVSGSLDGKVCFFDINSFKKLRELRVEPVKGISMTKDFSIIAIQTESKLHFYEENTCIKTLTHIFEGEVMECFHSRISWSPDDKYLAVGLSFNNYENSVEIINRKYESVYSLIGHVAPIEVVAFAPHVFTNGDRSYYIIAAASQDRSISIWCSENTRPPILLKNFTEQPVLDLIWRDSSIIVSSYDGSVKIIEFGSDLGEPGGLIEDSDIYIPFSLLNIEIEEQRKKHLADIQDQLRNHSLLEEQYQGTLKDEIRKESLESEEKKGTLEKDVIEDSFKGDLSKESSTIEIKNNESKNEIKKEKRRIKPMLIENKENKNIIESSRNSYFAIFKSEPEKELTCKVKTELKKKLDEFEVSIDTESGVLNVFRGNRKLYNISCCQMSSFCANKEFLVINSVNQDKKHSEECKKQHKECKKQHEDYKTRSELYIYRLESGTLILPTIITNPIVALDLLDQNLLIVEITKNFRVLDLYKQKQRLKDSIPGGTLLNIYFDKKFFIISEYPEGSYFYHQKMKIWMAKKREFNSKYTEEINFEESVDNEEFGNSDFQDLEHRLQVAYSVGDIKGILKISKEFIKLGKKCEFTEVDEYKFEALFDLLISIGCKREALFFLEELNGNSKIQPFVYYMIKKIKGV